MEQADSQIAPVRDRDQVVHIPRKAAWRAINVTGWIAAPLFTLFAVAKLGAITGPTGADVSISLGLSAAFGYGLGAATAILVLALARSYTP